MAASWSTADFQSYISERLLQTNAAISWGAGEGREAEVISVRFEADPNGAGTRVRLFLKYDPAHNLLGAAFARLFGKVPEEALERSLDQFKRLIVTGEISEAA